MTDKIILHFKGYYKQQIKTQKKILWEIYIIEYF